MCISFISNEVGIFFSWQFFPLCDVAVPEICLFAYRICLSLLICGNALSVLCGTTIFSQLISCLCIFLHSFLNLGYNSHTLKHIHLKYTRVNVLVYSGFCKHHHYLISKHFLTFTVLAKKPVFTLHINYCLNIPFLQLNNKIVYSVQFRCLFIGWLLHVRHSQIYHNNI